MSNQRPMNTTVLRAFFILMALPMVAIGGGWSDFSNVFTLYPCQDGWTGCVSDDGERLSPQVLWDESGRPLPGNFRVDWDGNATPSFSPFTGLSDYTDMVEEPTPEPVEREEVSREPVASQRPAATNTKNVASRREPTRQRESNDTREQPTRTERSSASRDRTHADDRVVQTVQTASKPAPVHSDEGKVAKQTQESVVAKIAVPEEKTVEPPSDVNCDSLRKFEAFALGGNLSRAQTACLKKRLANSSVQTEMSDISKLLMADVQAKGDTAGWTRLIVFHLENIDQSDPDICYSYARHLNKKGVRGARGAIRWSSVALENKTIWSGSKYTNRVYALWRYKTMGRGQLYQAANEAYQKEGTPETEAAMEKLRSQLKNDAREWYGIAVQSNKDPSKALAICTMAAGTDSYCTGR